MSVWLKNEKELMDWSFHCSFHYFTWWMTNKQTLPEGICILKEELINPNESLICGICRGDISDHWGFLLCLQGAGSPVLLHRLSPVLESELCVECSHILIVCPKCHWVNWQGVVKRSPKENKCRLALWKMNVWKLNNKWDNFEGLLKNQVRMIYFIINF